MSLDNPALFNTHVSDEETALTSGDLPPPSYDSLNFINKLKKAKEHSTNPAQYITSAGQILCDSGKNLMI